MSADGTHIAYERTGSGPTLILIDAAGHFRANSPLGELGDLLVGDFTVVRYDRRGRGASTDTPPYTPAREVDDLAALIAAVGGPARLYGYSSGGLVALYGAAAGLDLHRLALLEPPIEPAADDQEQRAFIARLRELTGADAVEFFLASIGVPAEALAGMRGTRHWNAMVSAAATLVYDSELSEALTTDLLGSVTTPTLVLDSEGSTDGLTHMARIAARLLPHAVHRSLPGEWHTVSPAVLAPVVGEFLH